jgi:hypothetical protein
VPQCHNDEYATHELVKATIDKLLTTYPQGHADIANFIKLLNFEKLLRGKVPASSEHVLHSFRVFLAGCSIITRYYVVFRQAYTRLSLGGMKQFSLEYMWLLTAIFHDIGRVKEGLGQYLEATFDPLTNFGPTGKDTRWLIPEYKDARRALCSLGAFISNTPSHNGKWDGGVVSGSERTEFGKDWPALYDSYKSHAVISAFDLLAEVFEKASAIEEIDNRLFVVAHAVPAALAIFLHDWRIWEQATTWKLHPIDMAALPLAAVLVYLDTWDDYKRKGTEPTIFIEDYSVTPRRGAGVVIKWASDELYEREKGELKYRKLMTSLVNQLCGLNISSSVAGV